MTDRLAPGDLAPDFTLPDAEGNEVSLSGLRGKQVIIYFYPAAMTPGCTKQACDFRDSRGELTERVTVLGISPDSPAKLAKFRDKEGLTFPLLSDPGREVLKAYGAYGEKKMYGKTTVGVIRSTFVVGEDGRIERRSTASRPPATSPGSAATSACRCLSLSRPAPETANCPTPAITSGYGHANTTRNTPANCSPRRWRIPSASPTCCAT